MSAPARSLFVFAIYLTCLGLGLVIIPNVLLRLFGIPGTQEVWIRIVGMLMLFLSFYFFQAVRTEWTDFFRWSVYPRSLVIVFLGAFVLTGMAPRIILLFGVIDLLAALWTASALRSATMRAEK